jgi:hypothetical protein
MKFVYCVLFQVAAFLVGNPAGGYTPEDLFLLMDASMQRYETMTAEISGTSYDGRDQNGKRRVQRTQQILSRWAQGRSLSRTTESYVERPHPTYPESTVTTMVITPKWNKELREASDGRISRGFIRSGATYESEFITPIAAMWDISGSGVPLDKQEIDLKGARVEKDEATGHFLLTYRLGSHKNAARYVLHIDPNKGFVPVVKEFQTHDGRLLQRHECVLEKTPDGLWIPTEYSWRDPRVDYSTVYKVNKVEVNTEIPPHLLDFAFPSGTLVEDEITNLRYQVDDPEVAESMIDSLENEAAEEPKRNPEQVQNTRVNASSGSGMNEQDLQVRALATDEELENVVSQTEALGLSYRDQRASSSGYYGWLWIAMVGCGLLLVVAFLLRRILRGS